MGRPPFQQCKVPGHPHCENLYVALTNDTKSRKRGFKTYDRRGSAPGTHSRRMCSEDNKTFVVRVDWRQYQHSLEELHVNIKIEGAVMHSMVLKKDVQVMKGKTERATVSHQAVKYTKSGCDDRLPFIVPPARSESTFEHASSSSEAGVISVDIYTATGDRLAMFLFERRTEAFLRSEGFKVVDCSLSKGERKAQNRLQALKETRNSIDVQIKEAEERWDRLQKGKLARQTGPQPCATGPSTSDNQVLEAPRGVSDLEDINHVGQEAQEVKDVCSIELVFVGGTFGQLEVGIAK